MASSNLLALPRLGGISGKLALEIKAVSGAAELTRLQFSERREQPYGDDAWVLRTVQSLGLDHTPRPEGRPPRTQGEATGNNGPSL